MSAAELPRLARGKPEPNFCKRRMRRTSTKVRIKAVFDLKAAVQLALLFPVLKSQPDLC